MVFKFSLGTRTTFKETNIYFVEKARQGMEILLILYCELVKEF